MLAITPPPSSPDDVLFARIADELKRQGYAVIPNALPENLASTLLEEVMALDCHDYCEAGIGRQSDLILNPFVRRDEICWITGGSPAEHCWLQWVAGLQQYLNQHLFLGLFSFESHFAHYQPGDFYRKHLDAFRGNANRRLSMVAYLNPGWLPEDGGELAIYDIDSDKELVRVTPAYATLVVFLSEDFPHEVLKAKRHRHSIAGWFRVNSSSNGRVDPPR